MGLSKKNYYDRPSASTSFINMHGIYFMLFLIDIIGICKQNQQLGRLRDVLAKANKNLSSAKEEAKQYNDDKGDVLLNANRVVSNRNYTEEKINRFTISMNLPQQRRKYLLPKKKQKWNDNSLEYWPIFLKIIGSNLQDLRRHRRRRHQSPVAGIYTRFLRRWAWNIFFIRRG